MPAPSSRYRGVLLTPDGRFQARVFIGRTGYGAGRWPTERAAAIAWDRAALYLGHPGPLHLPRTSRELGPASPAALRQQARMAHRKATRAGKDPGRRYSTQYIGVIQQRQGWQGVVHHEGRRRVSTGTFPTAREAAVARDRVLIGLGSSDLTLRNFPDESLKPATLDEMRALGGKLHRAPHRISRYRGVIRRSLQSRREWWMGVLRVGATAHWLGSWSSQRKAALAHDRAALHYGSPPTVLNFPRQAHLLVPADAATLRREARLEYKQRTSSRYSGVSWSKMAGRWEVHVRAQNVRYLVGYFDDEDEAGRAYDRAARKLQGRRARLNFPESEAAPARARSRAASSATKR